MLKKTITYTDFDGNEQTEDFYFNLTKTELVELEFSQGGGYGDSLKKIAKSSDGQKIIDTFKEILSKAYGVRSEDGKRFKKSPELFEEFTQTAAYDALFLELATDAEKSAAFVNGLAPSGLVDSANKSASEIARERSEANMQGHNKAQPKDNTVQVQPELPTANPQLESSSQDLSNMSREDLEKLLRERNFGQSYLK